ncbi:MAG TPA: hypothetical protein VKT29_17720 [Terriglobales bacterium]|nr:hypothetical protein [Terriglobales bacterium]
MKGLALFYAALLAVVLPLSAGIAGTFRGIIVHPPQGEASRGWIYVQGRNGNLRRAEVSRAVVLYASDVPQSLREKVPARSLREGVEVRVTASQDGDGEWRATRVEILRLRPQRRHKPRVRPATNDSTPGLKSAG